MSLTNHQIPHRPEGQTVTFRSRISYLQGQINQLRTARMDRLVPRDRAGRPQNIQDEQDLRLHTFLLCENLLSWVRGWTLLQEVDDPESPPLELTAEAAAEWLEEADLEFLSWRGISEEEKAKIAAQIEVNRQAAAAEAAAAGEVPEEGPYAEKESFPVGGTA